MSEWQPIETAPKDKTLIVYQERCPVMMAKWARSEQDDDDLWYGPDFYLIWPTHWMPLPEQPQE